MRMGADEAMSEITIITCGSSTSKCKCACSTGGPCEHKWGGPVKELERGASVTCSRCGMDAMSHDLWVGP